MRPIQAQWTAMLNSPLICEMRSNPGSPAAALQGVGEPTPLPSPGGRGRKSEDASPVGVI